MEENKALVEQWWINLYDSIEPAKEKVNYSKAYRKAYQKTDKYKAYKKAYQKAHLMMMENNNEIKRQ